MIRKISLILNFHSIKVVGSPLSISPIFDFPYWRNNQIHQFQEGVGANKTLSIWKDGRRWEDRNSPSLGWNVVILAAWAPALMNSDPDGDRAHDIVFFGATA